jgi:hypothetical protein
MCPIDQGPVVHQKPIQPVERDSSESITMKKCMYCGGTVRETDETCPNCEEPTAPILRKKPAPRELVFQSTRTRKDGDATAGDGDKDDG